MAFTVNTNTAATSAITNLNRSSRALGDSFRKISSGLRVSKAADDAAGLAVAENLEAQSRSARVAMRNINDGVSVIATAEGASDEIGNILKRMRELAVQSSSETLASGERAYLETEFQELSSEIDRIANTTEFNGVSLTDGTSSTLAVQVGVNATADDRISITLGDMTASTLAVDTGSVSVSSVAGAQSAITALDTALDSVSTIRAGFGATENRLNSAMNNLETYNENLEAARSRIVDADFAFETAQMSKHQIMQQAGTAILAQAKNINSSALSLVAG
jgi:flagellin